MKKRLSEQTMAACRGSLFMTSLCTWVACGSDVTVLDLPGEVADSEPSSWEEFRASAEREGPSGETYYVVEWDLPMRDELELWEYYEAHVTGGVDKGVVRLDGSGDDVWPNNDQLHLRYCVDADAVKGFDAAPVGVNTVAAVVAAMQQAVVAWQNVVNVSVTYDPSRNNDCSLADPVPDNQYFKVSRFDSSNVPCAFYPKSRFTCPGLDGKTIGLPSNYSFPGPPAWTLPGTMMHEVGHIWGLIHEHEHTSGGGCAPTDTARNLSTVADTVSMMGYPNTANGFGCSLVTPSGSSLSAGDGAAGRSLYGSPGSWFAAYSYPMIQGS